MSEKRDAYVAKMKARLDKWNVKIDTLEAAGQKVKADSKTEYDNQIKNLKAKRAESSQGWGRCMEGFEGGRKKFVEDHGQSSSFGGCQF
jgi:hypothetical protein